MTALVPAAIDLHPIGSFPSQSAFLVGGPTPWTTSDGDTSYIQLEPFQPPAGGGSTCYVNLLIPPGLPLEWFSNPTFDIDVRATGSLIGAPFRVFLNAGDAFDGAFAVDDFAITAAYGVERHVVTDADPDEIPLFWGHYSGGGDTFMGLLYAQPGAFGAPDPSIASARVTYFALITPGRTPLRGRQRAAGVSGSIPLRGRNNAPYGLRGRQEANR